MKKILWTFIGTILLLGCKSKSVMKPDADIEIVAEKKTLLKTHYDSAIKMLTDPIGMMYYELIPKTGNNVVTYRYEENLAEDIMDGHYIEEVILEFPKNIKSGIWKNEQLTTFNALFGRQCFCRGEAGNFFIENGTLIIRENKKDFQFLLEFEMVSGRQITKIISGTLPKK
jgi:hypothetical protein